MQRILSNIEEGMLTVNNQMLVESEYSHYLNTLLHTEADLTGQPALPLLLDKTSLGSEDKSMVHEALHASWSEDELHWFVKEQHIPAELIYPTSNGVRIVAVHWQLLFDKQNKVQNVLIGLSDVTERRKLEAEVVLEREAHELEEQLQTFRDSPHAKTRGTKFLACVEEYLRITLNIFGRGFPFWQSRAPRHGHCANPLAWIDPTSP